MFARRIAVVGTGYVGLTTGACLASLRHRVVCADVDEAKVARLRDGNVDILEPGLADLVTENLLAGRLSFVVGAEAAVADAEVVFLCLPTPMGDGGGADLSVVEAVLKEIRELLRPDSIVVAKSTVPAGTAARLARLLDRDDVAVVSNPEFLREGTAVSDFLKPDRIVVGADQPHAAERVAAVYAGLGAPILLTDAVSAEMIKYVANGFLAMKLSYVNAVADLCEQVGANILDVTDGMGYDPRIGRSFLAPGPGWGGSCLPKDTRALLHVSHAADFEFPLLEATIDTNTRHQERIVEKIAEAVRRPLAGARICLLGLTFKAGTDDLRESPALAVASLLFDAGAELTGYDPGVPAAVPGVTDVLTVVDDPYRAARGAAAVVLITEWPQFRTLDWAQLADVVRQRVVVDVRNLLDFDVLRRFGFEARGVGRA
jgi:UDPglucose 6-dehydrogenase